MRDGHALADYEAVRPPRRPEAGEPAEDSPSARAGFEGGDLPGGARARKRRKAPAAEPWVARRGHLISYFGLFLFTAFVFFRPYELFSLPGLKEGAQWVAVFTLLVYFPSQFGVEGNLTARPREVVFALLLLLTALLSVPTAISPGEAWEHFVEFLKVILMFVVMVNVARTERRLRGLLLVAMVVTVMLSAQALLDYQAGRLEMRGDRVKGALGGLFDNPNDLALHLVTMVPIAVGLAFARRGPLKKLLYAACAVLFVAGVVVTFSRGGFLGLLAAAGVLAWKLGRKNRFLVATLGAVALAVFIAAAPGGYGERIGSMFYGDAQGSASARRDILVRSALVALRYPVTGVGIGNFYYRGQHDQVTHNAYTQVASEMGLAALVFYVLLIVSPLRRLGRMERESFGRKEQARFYYLAVGLQASLAGYMVSSFFASVAFLWYAYYLVGYSVCLRRLYALEYGEGAAAVAEGRAARPASSGAAAEGVTV